MSTPEEIKRARWEGKIETLLEGQSDTLTRVEKTTASIEERLRSLEDSRNESRGRRLAQQGIVGTIAGGIGAAAATLFPHLFK